MDIKIFQFFKIWFDDEPPFYSTGYTLKEALEKIGKASDIKYVRWVEVI